MFQKRFPMHMEGVDHEAVTARLPTWKVHDYRSPHMEGLAHVKKNMERLAVAAS